MNWQPISEMPLVARMIDGIPDDAREHLKTLSEARVRPHVLDDATINRTERVTDMSDLELGLQALLGTRSPGRR